MPLYAWIAIGVVALGALAAWALCRINREDVCPDPYDPQDFIGGEARVRPMPEPQPTPRVQPWQDWADVFPRYTDGHDGPGGVVTKEGGR